MNTYYSPPTMETQHVMELQQIRQHLEVVSFNSYQRASIFNLLQ